MFAILDHKVKRSTTGLHKRNAVPGIEFLAGLLAVALQSSEVLSEVFGCSSIDNIGDLPKPDRFVPFYLPPYGVLLT